MYSNPVIPFSPIWWRWIAKVFPPLFLLLCWTLSFSVYITHPGVEGRRCHTFGRCVLCNARIPVNKGRKPFHLISLEIHDADNAPRGTRLTTTTLPIVVNFDLCRTDFSIRDDELISFCFAKYENFCPSVQMSANPLKMNESTSKKRCPQVCPSNTS